MAQTKEDLKNTIARQRKTIEELKRQRGDLWDRAFEQRKRIEELREDVVYYQNIVAQLSSLLATYMEEEAPKENCTTVRLCPNY